MRAPILLLLAACAASPTTPRACPEGAAGSHPSANDKAPLLASARRVECSGYPARVGVTLRSSAGAAELTGVGSDNYATAEYKTCSVTGAEIRCRGKWSGLERLADLRIMSEPNGTFMAEVVGQHGQVVVMSCLVTD